MKIYAIAKRARECYGHGDYGDEDKICRTGPWGTGAFHPAFTSREEADSYLDQLKWKSGMLVVEMDLLESTGSPLVVNELPTNSFVVHERPFR